MFLYHLLLIQDLELVHRCVFLFVLHLYIGLISEYNLAIVSIHQYKSFHVLVLCLVLLFLHWKKSIFMIGYLICRKIVNVFRYFSCFRYVDMIRVMLSLIPI